MIVTFGGKEYSFNGFVYPLNSINELVNDAYYKGRADAIEEVKEAINNNGAYQMNPQITEYDKGSDDAFEIVIDILKQLKEQKLWKKYE